MSEVNIDAAMIKNDVSLNHDQEMIVEMSNGCICCTLRADLLIEKNRLANEGKFDYLFIDQVEFADVILISKTYLIDSVTLRKIKAIIRRLNTIAKLIPITTTKG